MGAMRLDHTFFDNEVRPHLGALLLEKGLVTQAQLDAALAERTENGGLLGETLVRLGFIFEDELARVLAEQAGVPFINLDTIPADPHAGGVFRRELGERLCALPVRFTAEGALVIAVSDPTDENLLPQLQSAVNCPIVLAVATASTIRYGWRTIAYR
jgi:Type II secretion system (T2SS), protein E, N-terminal domain